MNVSATDATDCARLTPMSGESRSDGDVACKVRCSDCTESPTLEVRGLGKGICAVTHDMKPSWSLNGNPDRSLLIAFVKQSINGKSDREVRTEPGHLAQDPSLARHQNLFVNLFGEDRAALALRNVLVIS